MRDEIIELIKELSGGEEITFEHRIVCKSSPHSHPFLIKRINTNLEAFDIDGNIIKDNPMILPSVLQRLKTIKFIYEKRI